MGERIIIEFKSISLSKGKDFKFIRFRKKR